MARSTRESIVTAAAELMRHKGYGAVAMKDIAAASGAPIGSLYHHFRGGKVQIAHEALINAGHAYALLIPSIVEPYRDLGDAIDAIFTQAAEDMARTGFANMCPVASVAAEIADTVEQLRETSAGVFEGWVDGGGGTIPIPLRSDCGASSAAEPAGPSHALNMAAAIATRHTRLKRSWPMEFPFHAARGGAVRTVGPVSLRKRASSRRVRNPRPPASPRPGRCVRWRR